MTDSDDEFSIYNIMYTLMIFSVISVFAIFVILFVFAVWHDYVFVSAYNVALNLTNTTTYVSTTVLTQIDSIVVSSETILQYVDMFWFAMFLTMVANIFIVAYRTKREGIIPILSLLTYGVLIFLFLSSVAFAIASQLKIVLIDRLFYNLHLPLPFFNWYMTNYGLINLIIIVIVIILNFVDFQIFKFANQKNNDEQIDEEI